MVWYGVVLYGMVWYQPNGVVNMLSLSDVKKKYSFTYDSELEDGFIVHKDERAKHIFRPSKKWLIYSDMTNNVGTVQHRKYQ